MRSVSIIGGSMASEDILSDAERIGRFIGSHGIVLVCGGKGGVMEAAARGAKSSGGITVGIVPSYNRKEANEYIDIVIPTGMGLARNVLVVNSGDIVVAIDGREGTLSEIALALNLGKPLVIYRGPEISRMDEFKNYGDRFRIARSVDEVIEILRDFFSL